MIKIENTETYGWEATIRRNRKNHKDKNSRRHRKIWI